MNPEKISPEEQAATAKSRTLSDAELIKGGAEYVPVESGEPRLEVTAEQSEMLHADMDRVMTERKAVLQREITRENAGMDLRALIAEKPELRDKIECLEVQGGHNLFVIKIKEVPSIGIIVSSEEGGGDQTRLHFNYIDDKSPERTVYKEMVSPVPAEMVTGKDGTELRRDAEDGSINPEFAARAKEIVEILEKMCSENALAALAIRQGNSWEGWGLPKPKNVEILDARYPDVFTGKLGMPDYRRARESSWYGGYDTKKPFPVFDWHREN